jgi:hypothetical protein
MRRGALENEVACLAAGGSDDQAPPFRPNAALDVAEILLEHVDGQTKIMTEIVEFPLAFGQSFDDPLTSRALH